MHQPSKIIKNTLLFTGALVIQKLISFTYFWYLSTHLVPDILGAYIWALSFTTLFSIGIDLGFSPVLNREAARHEENAERYLKTVLGFKIPLAALTLLTLWAVLVISGKSAEILLLVLGASAVMIFDSFSLSFYAILRSRQNLKYESLGILLFQVITLVLGITFLELTHNIAIVMLALVAASAFNLFFSLGVLRLRFGLSVRPELDWQVARHFLRIVPVFALAGIFIKIYNVADSVLLGYLADEHAVGLYSIPAKAISAFQALIPGAFAASIFPAMSNYYVTSKERLRKLFEKSFGYLLLLALPISFGLFILAPSIIRTIWPGYLGAVSTFQVMALGIPFMFLAFSTGTLLNASDRQKQNTANRGIITACNVVLNIILIPFLGVLGAGVAFLLTNIMLIGLDFIWVGKIILYAKKELFFLGAKGVLAGLLMMLFIWFLLSKLNLFFLILTGTIVYFALIILFRAVTKGEIQTIKNLLFAAKQ